MTIAPRLRQFLDSEGVRYDVVSHPRTATSSQSAEVAHIPGNQVAKSVVVHHELGYVLAVVPSTKCRPIDCPTVTSSSRGHTGA